MSNFRVFYDPATGRISGHEFSNTPSTRDGRAHIDLEQPFDGLYHLKHKVDLATGSIVEMTDAEKYEAQLPTEHDVRAAVFQELTATDSMFVPGRLNKKDTDAWMDYRQQLRDLSKKGLSHTDQLHAWPARPDGLDAIGLLRGRTRRTATPNRVVPKGRK